MTPIKLKYDDLTESIFKILAPLSAPILIQTIAEKLNQPVEVITTTLDKMIMNGAPLRRCKLPGGDAVSY